MKLLHLFHDVNCRTNYFLLNQELALNGIKPAMLYNPNRMDCYSKEEFIEEVKQGIFRHDFVISNQKVLTEKHRDLERGIRKTLKSDHFHEMSKPLQEKLTAFALLQESSKAYSALNQGHSGFFKRKVETDDNQPLEGSSIHPD